MRRLKGINQTTDVLAKNHLKSLSDNSGGFRCPKKQLEKFLKKKHQRKWKTEFITKIVADFENIIVAKPMELFRLAKKLGPVTNADFSKFITQNLKYEQFRSSKLALDFIGNLGIKSCPYCNAQYVLSLDKEGKALCQFDHVISKDLYPYLSLSYFNLVPCCASCNHMKSNTDVLNEASFVHPFNDSFADKILFKASSSAINKFYTNGRTVRGDVNIIIDKLDNVDYHLDTFKLLEVYNEHHDFIDEIYLKSIMYNSSRRKELTKLYVHSGQMTQEELDRLIYSTYMSKEDINKRPLAKFHQDLIDQFNGLNS